MDLTGGAIFTLNLSLFGAIIPGSSSFRCLETKVEVKLQKARAGLAWPSLEGSASPASAPPAALPMASSTQLTDKAEKDVPAYPSSSRKAKDWNALEHQVVKEEEEEKPTGDEALNKVHFVVSGK